MRVGLDFKQMRQSTAEFYCQLILERAQVEMQAVQVSGQTVVLLKQEVGFLGDVLVLLNKAAEVMVRHLGGAFPFIIIDEKNQKVRSEREYWQALEPIAKAWCTGKRATDAIFADIDALIGPPGVATTAKVHGWPQESGPVTTSNSTRSPAEEMIRPTPFPNIPPRT